ncbi:hypothetical protein AGMMS50230_12370 [Spirochaetia bacterium]|nr:hypothetical protein AGMMS50230_12370 [Spirochaetia bacterium]
MNTAQDRKGLDFPAPAFQFPAVEDYTFFRLGTNFPKGNNLVFQKLEVLFGFFINIRLQLADLFLEQGQDMIRAGPAADKGF